jgi:hypothetical protein
MNAESAARLRQYAAGEITWVLLRQKGFENYRQVLARLGELGLRVPMAPMDGPKKTPLGVNFAAGEPLRPIRNPPSPSFVIPRLVRGTQGRIHKPLVGLTLGRPDKPGDDEGRGSGDTHLFPGATTGTRGPGTGRQGQSCYGPGRSGELAGDTSPLGRRRPRQPHLRMINSPDIYALPSASADRRQPGKGMRVPNTLERYGLDEPRAPHS